MIAVNEIFGPTIQGEGINAGKPVAFLRLAGCNLQCFKCDTPFTWNYQQTSYDHVDNIKFDKAVEVHMYAPGIVCSRLLQTEMKHLVISGGEPLLQQRALLPMIREMKLFNWFVESETNGTMVPLAEFVDAIDQINCSPKLQGSFSGQSEQLRIRPEALKALSSTNKTNFKFVISEPENVDEVLRLVDMYNLRQVRLMPECRTNEEMEAKEQMVRELCTKHNFIYCTRLSIKLSGTKRGV